MCIFRCFCFFEYKKTRMRFGRILDSFMLYLLQVLRSFLPRRFVFGFFLLRSTLRCQGGVLCIGLLQFVEPVFFCLLS